jgi:hypothetical protein
MMRLALIGLILVSWTACSDGETTEQADVMVTCAGASAVYGGCGDAPPPPSDAGPPPPCGPQQDFSVALRLENKATVTRQVAIVGVVVLDETGKELNSAAVSQVLAGGATFDGQLPAGATLSLKVELDPLYLALTGSSDTIRYRVSLTVDGQPTTVDSPKTTYSGPPA